MTEPVPIIVVGMNRSGTKWVSNILCNHDSVIGVRSHRARGIIETNMFGLMQQRFDLSSPDDYIGFIELWASTEFFQTTGVDKQFFYQLNPRPRKMLELFELLMREYALANQKSYWLQKTGPANAAVVLRHFRNAKVVITRRSLLDTVKSTWVMEQRYGRRSLIRTAFEYSNGTCFPSSSAPIPAGIPGAFCAACLRRWTPW